MTDDKHRKDRSMSSNTREGPEKKESFTCLGCKYLIAKRHQFRGVVGYDHFCSHSDAAIGGAPREKDSCMGLVTEPWCPFLAARSPDADRLVTVCAGCLCASCWQGKQMCHGSDNAATIRVPVSDLRALGREHECYWTEACERGEK